MTKRRLVVLVVLCSLCIWLSTLTTSSSASIPFRFLNSIQGAEQGSSEVDSAQPPVLTVPISLVVPCAAEDFFLLPPLLTSIAKQTALPSETLIIVNIGRREGEEQVSIMKFNQDADDPLEFPVGQEFYRDYLKEGEPLESVVRKIPNLRVYLRSEAVYAGNNRAFGNRQAKNEIISFFDCDDYMLPQRMLVLYEMFQEHYDLDAVIHGYMGVEASNWLPFIEMVQQEPNPTDDKSFPWTYQQIQESLPPGKDDDNPEQNWFFPRGMATAGKPPLPGGAHNGWLTVKKQALLDVPYPEDVSRGQDSIYNWRLIKHKKNWNYTPLRLGIYILHR